MKNARYWRHLGLFGLGTVIVGLLILIVAIMHLSYRSAYRYVHPLRTRHIDDETPARFGIPYQDVALHTNDGLVLKAWYTIPANGAMILVAHGYSGHRWDEMHAFFARHGYGVLSWDFRANGESEGELCTVGYEEALDVEAALDFALVQDGVDWVGAFGYSMGGVAIIEASARRPEIQAIVADSSFYSLEAQLAKAVPVAPLRPLIRFFAERETKISVDLLRPVDRIGWISPRPVMVIQGMSDTVIPVESAQRLYDAAGEPRTVWIEPDVEHCGMREVFPDEYERRVIAFFDAARSE